MILSVLCIISLAAAQTNLFPLRQVQPNRSTPRRRHPAKKVVENTFEMPNGREEDSEDDVPQMCPVYVSYTNRFVWSEFYLVPYQIRSIWFVRSTISESHTRCQLSISPDHSCPQPVLTCETLWLLKMRLLMSVVYIHGARAVIPVITAMLVFSLYLYHLIYIDQLIGSPTACIEKHFKWQQRWNGISSTSQRTNWRTNGPVVHSPPFVP